MTRFTSYRRFNALPKQLCYCMSAVLALTCFNTMAASSSTIDSPNYDCKYCSFDYSPHFDFSAGLYYIQGNANSFSSYNPFDKDGTFLIFQGEFEERTSDGFFTQLSFNNPTSESPSFIASYGRQGKYRGSIFFREFQSYQAENSETPFYSSNNTSFLLPDNWSFAGSTQQMDNSLFSAHHIPLNSRRSISGFNLTYQAKEHWVSELEIKRNQNKGHRLVGTNILTTGVLLPAPEDYTTDSLESTLLYHLDNWQLKLGYYLSLFDNNISAIRWQNPFTPIIGETTEGQMSSEPDNRFHQLNVFYHLRPFEHSQLSISSSFGKGTQNDDFLPPTINNLLTYQALPQDSLDGSVDTRHWRLRFTTRFNESWTFNSSYRYDKRYNHTALREYPQVVTDSYNALSKMNIAYGYRKEQADIRLSWKTIDSLTMQLQLDQQNVQRYYQETKNTKTEGIAITTKITPDSHFDIRLKLHKSKREAENIDLSLLMEQEQNPLLRRYYLANLNRSESQIIFNLFAFENMNISFSANHQTENYPDTQVGLNKGSFQFYNLDFSLPISKTFSASLFLSHENSNYQQNGSQSFSFADWFALNRDTSKNLGGSLSYQSIDEQWSVKSRVLRSQFRGTTQINTEINSDPFPDMTSERYRLDINARYQLTKSTSLNVEYLYENFDNINWQLDTSNLSQINNYLITANSLPHYEVHLLAISVGFRF